MDRAKKLATMNETGGDRGRVIITYNTYPGLRGIYLP